VLTKTAVDGNQHWLIISNLIRCCLSYDSFLKGWKWINRI